MALNFSSTRTSTTGAPQSRLKISSEPIKTPTASDVSLSLPPNKQGSYSAISSTVSLNNTTGTANQSVKLRASEIRRKLAVAHDSEIQRQKLGDNMAETMAVPEQFADQSRLPATSTTSLNSSSSKKQNICKCRFPRSSTVSPANSSNYSLAPSVQRLRVTDVLRKIARDSMENIDLTRHAPPDSMPSSLDGSMDNDLDGSGLPTRKPSTGLMPTSWTSSLPRSLKKLHELKDKMESNSIQNSRTLSMPSSLRNGEYGIAIIDAVSPLSELKREFRAGPNLTPNRSPLPIFLEGHNLQDNQSNVPSGKNFEIRRNVRHPGCRRTDTDAHNISEVTRENFSNLHESRERSDSGSTPILSNDLITTETDNKSPRLLKRAITIGHSPPYAQNLITSFTSPLINGTKTPYKDPHQQTSNPTTQTPQTHSKAPKPIGKPGAFQARAFNSKEFKKRLLKDSLEGLADTDKTQEMSPSFASSSTFELEESGPAAVVVGGKGNNREGGSSNQDARTLDGPSFVPSVKLLAKANAAGKTPLRGILKAADMGIPFLTFNNNQGEVEFLPWRASRVTWVKSVVSDVKTFRTGDAVSIQNSGGIMMKDCFNENKMWLETGKGGA
ncbi:hypothetical protein BCR33DRAFT_718638 [Rhizoclosmatium globosum]|uniref:Uncharacterized protein n=1 Tax=Rhizoclosmatium globosum TaxID=329046 RepID=A0A1Y2C546_9FUNG|nr:hypothetical protein BCR33DRAFT_718638 [Rhizoclosmatium globosum]|eukprot:ORY42004.1 hypothetical protein BCR33DRAFT_718638 [Rhizoclosmatium globosum]